MVIVMDCIFCSIIKGDIPSYKIYEDDTVLAFLDINPVKPGHTLIIPKEHTLDVTTINDEVLITILDKSKDIGKLLMEKLDAKGFTLEQNNGIAQEIKHFHLHVIPKYNKKVIMSIEEIHQKITN